MVLEVYEAEAQTVVDPNARLEQLADGFQFTEGPVWHVREQCLFFSDIPANTLYRYSPTAGVTVHRQPSHFSNGLTLDGAGQLLACTIQPAGSAVLGQMALRRWWRTTRANA